MYAYLVSILTCLAMLWHTVVGCCWHHDHSECLSSDLSNEISQCAPASKHCSHDHDGHHHPDSQDDDSHAPEPCNHSQHCGTVGCVYLKTISLDITALSHTEALFVSTNQDAAELDLGRTFLIPHRDIVSMSGASSAQQHCALFQSWLL